MHHSCKNVWEYPSLGQNFQNEEDRAIAATQKNVKINSLPIQLECLVDSDTQ